MLPIRKILCLALALASVQPVYAENFCSRIFTRILTFVGLRRPAPALAPLAPELIPTDAHIRDGNKYFYTTPWALFHPEGKKPLTKEEQLELLKNFETAMLEKDLDIQANLLTAWITSPTHAIFVMQNLRTLNTNPTPLLKKLMASSKYFKDVHPVKGGEEGLITLAYDIEDPGEGFTMMYRTKDYTDGAWLELPDKERKEKLYEANIRNKPIEPTELKPSHLGRMTFESSRIFEVKHRLFEINSATIKNQLTELFQIKKNTHSAHIHLVSEFPLIYKQIKPFLLWRMQLSDYLEYKGMEEGLISDAKTYTGRSRESKDAFRTGEWEDANDKLTGIGLRTDVYGPAMIPGHVRIGLEFRDSTRKPDLLNKYIDEAISDLQTRPWEKMSADQVKKYPYSNTDSEKFLRSQGFNIGEAELYRTVPFSLVDIDFSKQKHYDFRTQTWKKPDPAVITRINAATEKLKKNLQNTLKEQREKNYAPDDVIAALKLDLIEWAKEAKVSELYPEHLYYSLPVKK